ncbi:MAG: PorP/SprF family type IX secretion system membrane protein [Bacteroidales bacterium]|nr:PorP/SprF family type IX secretion system membrane protein [Bacteroidales bacterium]
MNSIHGHNHLKGILRIHSLFILFSISFSAGLSQDIHFTLFNNSPLYINPANTGNFDGNWRITGNYRDQWRAISEPFTTASVGFDMHFYIYNQKIDGGICIINDNSGAIGLTANKFYLSLAYEKSLNKNLFRFGLQAGYAFLSFGGGDVTYPSDWNFNTGTFDNGNPSEKSSYPDINIGVIWKSAVKIFEPQVGISLSHINFPSESFFDAGERLPVRYHFHGSTIIRFSEKVYFHPAFIYMNRKAASEMVMGTNIGFRLFEKRSALKELAAGLYFRDEFFKNTDALSIAGGVTIGRIDILLCYDYNISGLKAATGNRGAFELSFAYRSISTVLNSYSIPCERF